MHLDAVETQVAQRQYSLDLLSDVILTIDQRSKINKVLDRFEVIPYHFQHLIRFHGELENT